MIKKINAFCPSCKNSVTALVEEYGGDYYGGVPARSYIKCLRCGHKEIYEAPFAGVLPRYDWTQTVWGKFPKGDAPKLRKIILMIDVEATALYGEPFAVGAAVGELVGNLLHVTPLHPVVNTEKMAQSCDWVRQNVVPRLEKALMFETASIGDPVEATRDLLRRFMRRDDTRVEVWGDCIFPVECNLLRLAVDGDMSTSPYPLLDLANFLPVDKSRREFSGLCNLAEHDPTADAIASLASLARIKGWEIDIKPAKHFEEV